MIILTTTTARSYIWWFWAIALLGFSLDQTSKYAIFSHLYNDGKGGDIEIVSGAFKFTAPYTDVRETGKGLLSRLRTISGEKLPYVNRGALFGLGNSRNGGFNAVFALVSIAAALAIIFWSLRPVAKNDGFLCLSLGFILAGTFGNLFDRLVFGGVRDFLDFYLIDWPVFNIADCCLVCGAGLLLLQAFIMETHPAATEPAKDSEGAQESPQAQIAQAD